jgi:hypothetical protein
MAIPRVNAAGARTPRATAVASGRERPPLTAGPGGAASRDGTSVFYYR